MKKFKLLFILLFPVSILSNVVHAASVSFYTSGGGTVYPSQSINLLVSVNSDTAYNAVSVNVKFNNLNFISASPSSGWAPVSGPSQSGNMITFSGANLGGQYTGSKSVLNVSFRAPASIGNASVSSSGSVALADGSGTQVSGGGNTVNFNIITPPAAPKPSPSSVNVLSSSHPNQAQWYKIKDAIFSWDKQDGVNGYSYSIDQNASGMPDGTINGLDNSHTYTNLPDGTNYFHIKARNDTGFGPNTNFIINIDTSNPDPFTITRVKDTNSSDTLLYFATVDNVSGVASYSVNIDGKDLGAQKSPYRLVSTVSANKVIITALDKAGNVTTSTLILNETKTIQDSSVITSYLSGSQNNVSNVPSSNNQANTSSNFLPLIVSFFFMFLIGIGGLIFLFIKKSNDARDLKKLEENDLLLKNIQNSKDKNLPNKNNETVVAKSTISPDNIIK